MVGILEAVPPINASRRTVLREARHSRLAEGRTPELGGPRGEWRRRALRDETAEPGETSTPLLRPDERPPFLVRNPGASSPLLIIGDHAGCETPVRLRRLGLPGSELRRHIGWDIGVAALGEALAAALDACFIAQRYSRLVIDCNRDPARDDAVCVVSDGTRVPGNAMLSDAERRARVAEVFEPYHDRIEAEIDRRLAGGQRPVLLALHSFTPALAGVPRPWRFGVLHMGLTPYAERVRAALAAAIPAAELGDNQPYAMDGTDYTAPRHAIARGLDYLELEVRQDLIAEAEGARAMAAFLAPILARALDCN
jgi:predicted N-formylglutamate amidohydrolase